MDAWTATASAIADAGFLLWLLLLLLFGGVHYVRDIRRVWQQVLTLNSCMWICDAWNFLYNFEIILLDLEVKNTRIYIAYV